MHIFKKIEIKKKYIYKCIYMYIYLQEIENFIKKHICKLFNKY